MIMMANNLVIFLINMYKFLYLWYKVCEFDFKQKILNLKQIICLRGMYEA